MLPVVDPTALSFIDEAKSAARALAWIEAGLKESLHQIREVEAAVASEIGPMESFRQTQEKSFRRLRQEFRSMELRQIRRMPSIHRTGPDDEILLVKYREAVLTIQRNIAPRECSPIASESRPRQAPIAKSHVSTLCPGSFPEAEPRQ